MFPILTCLFLSGSGGLPLCLHLFVPSSCGGLGWASFTLKMDRLPVKTNESIVSVQAPKISPIFCIFDFGDEARLLQPTLSSGSASVYWHENVTSTKFISHKQSESVQKNIYNNPHKYTCMELSCVDVIKSCCLCLQGYRGLTGDKVSV